MGVNGLEGDLAAYYDQQAGQRAARELNPQRVTYRDQFLSLLRAEGRRTVLEVGTGPGQDGAAFIAAGVQVAGVDLSQEQVRLARLAGVDAQRASVFAMPFPSRSFQAGWTMSTLVHVPDDRFGAALDEIAARLVDGAPLAVGLWGGLDYQGPSDRDTIQPPRFFSLRSHERARRMLGRIGRVERFEIWQRAASTDWQYQWAVVRISHSERSFGERVAVQGQAGGLPNHGRAGREQVL